VAMEEVKECYREHFGAVFGVELKVRSEK